MKFNFRIPIVDSDVYIMVGDDLVGMAKKVIAEHGQYCEEEWYDVFKDARAVAFDIDAKRGKHGIVFLREELDDFLVAHEIWHLVFNICEASGIKFDSSELCANIAGHVYEQVVGFMMLEGSGNTKNSSKNPKP